jgi:hypothetical protein
MPANTSDGSHSCSFDAHIGDDDNTSTSKESAQAVTLTTTTATSTCHSPLSNMHTNTSPALLPRYSALWTYTFLLFALMGSGANWVLPSCLSQQIPVFERTLPEGLCIATFMNAATNAGGNTQTHTHKKSTHTHTNTS